MKTRNWIILAAIAGFLGAAAFYSPYIGINAQTPLTCPVCLHVSTVHGTPEELFIRFTLVFGIPNALLFAVVLWIVIFLGRALRRIVSK